MKKLSFAVAVGGLTFALCAAQQGEMIDNEYVITVAAGAADVTLNSDDVTALGSNVNLVKKGEGRLVIDRDLAGWVGELRVEAGYLQGKHPGAFGYAAANAASGGVVVTNGATVEIDGNFINNSNNQNATCKKWTIGGSGVGGTAGAIRLLNKASYWYNGSGTLKFVSDTTITGSSTGIQLDVRSGGSVECGGHTITIDGVAFCLANSPVSNYGNFIVKNGGKFVNEQSNFKTAVDKTISFADGTGFKITRPTNFGYALDFAGASTWTTQAWADDILKPLNIVYGPVRLGGLATVSLNKSTTAGGASGTEYNTYDVRGPVSGPGGFRVTTGWVILECPTNTFTGAVTVEGANSHVLATSLGAIPAITNGTVTIKNNATVEVPMKDALTPSAENDDYLLALYRYYPTYLANGSLKIPLDFDYTISKDVDGSSSPMTVPHSGSHTLELAGKVTGAKIVNDAGTVRVTGAGPHSLGQMDVRGGEVVFDGCGDVALGTETHCIGAKYPDLARLVVSNGAHLASDVSDPGNGTYKTCLGRSVGATGPVMRGIIEVGDGGTLSNRLSIADNGDSASVGSVFIRRGGSYVNPYSTGGGHAFGNKNHAYVELENEGTYWGWKEWTYFGRYRGGYGVYRQKGGHYRNENMHVVLGQCGGWGVAYLTGGEFYTTTSFWIGNLIWDAKTTLAAHSGGGGVLTIAGDATMKLDYYTDSLWLAGMNEATAIVNFNGGTFIGSTIHAVSNVFEEASNSAATNSYGSAGVDFTNNWGYVNFNGGTYSLRSGTSALNLVAGTERTRLTVGAGGAVFDTNGRELRVNRPLLKPSGKGVASVAFSCATPWEYAGSPAVVIEGDGWGASAYAEFDSTNGVVTGVVVTSPGCDYTWAKAKIMNAGTPNGVVEVDAVLADNAATGGLVKRGAGQLTINAACTYEGPTVAEAGTLKLGVENAISEKSALGVKTGATIDLNGKNPTVGGILPGGDGAITGDLTISGTWTVSAADLITRKCPTVNGRVTIAAGTRIVVEDPDNLLENPDNRRSYRLFNATAMTVNGPVSVGGDVDDQWRVINGGNNLRLSFMRGLQIIVR